MTKFAQVSWTAADVQTLAPRLTDAEAEDWLEANAKYITAALVDAGWDVISGLLHFDKIDMRDLPDSQEQS